ncbi:MAG: hypothetical protein M3R63_04775 [Actinomycetota bacterium]|nr:hypothetical protein [Actinomycetota bacterium]
MSSAAFSSTTCTGRSTVANPSSGDGSRNNSGSVCVASALQCTAVST